jgi:hypothetical protein
MSLFRRIPPASVAGITDRQLASLSPRDRRAYLATYQVSARDWTPAQLRQMERFADDIRRRQGSR